MTRQRVISWLSRGPRLATALLLLLVLGGAIGEATSLAGIATLLASRVTLVICSAIALCLLAGAAAALANEEAWSRRGGKALLLAGLAAVIFGLPATVSLREVAVFAAADGDIAGPGAPADLTDLKFGPIRVSPERSALLLSKTVEVEATATGGAPVRVSLWPPASIAGWKLTILRYGYAPEVDWRDERGNSRMNGFLMLGTFPQTQEDTRLVHWKPEPNLMMGVGFYPPKLEDLVSAPGHNHTNRIFLRMDEAKLGGSRRDLRTSDSWRWLADGRPESPLYHVELFEDRRKVYAGQIRGGEEASYQGGHVRLGEDIALWVEIEAVRDPFLPLVLAGVAMAALGLALHLAVRRNRVMR